MLLRGIYWLLWRSGRLPRRLQRGTHLALLNLPFLIESSKPSKASSRVQLIMKRSCRKFSSSVLIGKFWNFDCNLSFESVFSRSRESVFESVVQGGKIPGICPP